MNPAQAMVEFQYLDDDYQSYRNYVESLKSQFEEQEIKETRREFEAMQREMGEMYEYLNGFAILTRLESPIFQDHSEKIELLKQKEQEYLSRLDDEKEIVDIRGICERFVIEYKDHLRHRAIKEAYSQLPPDLRLAREKIEDLKSDIANKIQLRSKLFQKREM